MAQFENKSETTDADKLDVAIVGAGPTGLMAAEVAARAGRQVTVFDRMRQPGRKFLLAGADGLNLTNARGLADFGARLRSHSPHLDQALHAFGPDDLIDWANALDAQCFVGSSKLVFPKVMKASPLLRAWIKRLEGLGVTFVGQHSLTGWNKQSLFFDQHQVRARDTVLALGGASWPRVGTDGGWTQLFPAEEVTPLAASNAQFLADWSQHLIERHRGQPIKNLAAWDGKQWVQGDAIITRQGLIGGPVYAASAQAHASGKLTLDLRPNQSDQALADKLKKLPAKASVSKRLKDLGLNPTAAALWFELYRGQQPSVENLKRMQVPQHAPSPLDRAISTSGGVKFSQLDHDFAFSGRERTYLGGEMLDWDAPTGGYLLQCCFSIGFVIGQALAKSR